MSRKIVKQTTIKDTRVSIKQWDKPLLGRFPYTICVQYRFFNTKNESYWSVVPLGPKRTCKSLEEAMARFDETVAWAEATDHTAIRNHTTPA